jgi:ABC-type phosphate/phosphonate transport system substrate-binding protein
MKCRWPLRHAVLGLLAWLLASAATATPPTAEQMRIAVHMGALREASRADVEVSMKVWANEIMKVAEVPAEIFFYEALPEIQRDVEAGRVNFIIADGVSLLRCFAPNELADGIGSVGKGESTMLLLARRKAGISGARDLAGKRVVLLSENEISDLWLETTCLRTFRQRCAQASIAVSKEKRSRQQVFKLFFQKADAALVRSQAYEVAAELNPQIRDQLLVVERISIYPAALGLFSSRVSQEFRDYTISKVPLILNHPRGKQILEVLQSDQIGRVSRSLLDPIRNLMREHETLSERYLGRGGLR